MHLIAPTPVSDSVEHLSIYVCLATKNATSKRDTIRQRLFLLLSNVIVMQRSNIGEALAGGVRCCLVNNARTHEVVRCPFWEREESSCSDVLLHCDTFPLSLEIKINGLEPIIDPLRTESAKAAKSSSQ